MKTENNKSDELKKAIQEDINYSDDTLKNIKNLSDAAPDIQNRKIELEVLLNAVKRMPEDIVEEIAPRLLIVQRDSFQQFRTRVPEIARFHFDLPMDSTSAGTALPYHVEIVSLYKANPDAKWAKDSLNDFDHLASQKAKEVTLSTNLGRIDPNLPALLSAAVDSYEKSKIGIVDLDNAAMRIRDLIQQIWGALVANTQMKCGNQISNKRLALKTLAHREKVALCLAPNNKNELLLVLNQLFQLAADISAPAKDPMFVDKNLLDNFYTQLILQIDALFAWIDL